MESWSELLVFLVPAFFSIFWVSYANQRRKFGERKLIFFFLSILTSFVAGGAGALLHSKILSIVIMVPVCVFCFWASDSAGSISCYFSGEPGNESPTGFGLGAGLTVAFLAVLAAEESYARLAQGFALIASFCVSSYLLAAVIARCGKIYRALKALPGQAFRKTRKFFSASQDTTELAAADGREELISA